MPLDHASDCLERGRHGGEPFRRAALGVHRRARVLRDFTLSIDETRRYRPDRKA
jgi:hypothetical protein